LIAKTLVALRANELDNEFEKLIGVIRTEKIIRKELV
jgi:hypothetical protein